MEVAIFPQQRTPHHCQQVVRVPAAVQILRYQFPGFIHLLLLVEQAFKFVQQRRRIAHRAVAFRYSCRRDVQEAV